MFHFLWALQREFLARIKSNLRKNQASKDTTIHIADLELNNRTMEVKRAGKQIKLTPQEFSSLEARI